MIRPFFFLVSFLFAVSGFSRGGDDSLRRMLVGSWAKVDRRNASTNLPLEKSSSRIVTFYLNGKYQEEIPNSRFKNWKFLAAPTRWTLTNKNSKIKLFRNRNPSHDDFYDPDLVPIYGTAILNQVTQDTLILTVHSYSTSGRLIDSTMTFKRIQLRPARSRSEIRPNDLYLVNKTDTTQRLKACSFWNKLSIQIKNDTLTTYFHQVTGTLEHVTADSIVIEYSTETFTYADRNGVIRGFENENRSHYNGIKTRKGFLVKDVIFVTAQESKHPNLTFWGAGVVTLALVGTLIVSPLYALGKGYKTFDAHRFLASSSVSILTGLLVGVPFIAIGQGSPKEYYLDPESATQNKATCWSIKPFIYE